MRRYLLILVLAIATLTLSPVGLTPLVVEAQPASPNPLPAAPTVSQITQADQNGDGYIEVTTLETSFAGGTDRVLVFDGGEDMQQSDDWRVATDFENDTWIFDANSDGRAELVVQFVRVDASSVEARVFDDADGDGGVMYHVSAGTGAAVITESAAPLLTVTSWSSWTSPEGGLTYNLRIVQDGAYVNQEGPAELLSLMRRDGRPDFESVFTDEDGDGIPEYRIGRLLLPTPESSGFHRTGIQVNSGNLRPRENTAAVFWPLLGRDPTDRTGNYFETAPTIDVDWTMARVRDAGIVGYPIEQGFHVNALNYLLPGVRNVPSFENAMSYYDLDGDQDRRPELFIRHRYYEANDRHGENVVPASNEIRYSWTERNPNGLFWDYKLGLAGRHLITDTVRIGGYDVGIVPYERLPAWVTERTWDLATFVAREGQGYASSEGIYEWAPIEDKTSDIVRIDALTDGEPASFAAAPYIQGSTAVPPRGKFEGMRPGFRGEYAFEYGIRPTLYLSPVDRRVHLLRASGGIWQINATSAVQYADSNGDGWLDAWKHSQVDADGQIIDSRELHVLGDYIVYGDGEQTILRRAAVTPSVHEVVAPSTGEQVRALRVATEALGTQPGAADFREMQQQFEGTEQRIDGALLSDFRPLTDGGFRFVLETSADAAVDGNGPLNLSGVGPGHHVVTYSNDGVFTVEPLTEPSFVLDVRGEGVDGQPLAGGASGTIRMTLVNQGLRDATGLKLTLERVSEQGVALPLGEVSGDALAGEPLQAAISWPPASSGQWAVHVRVVNKQGEPVVDERRAIVLEPRVTSATGPLNLALPSTTTLLPALIPLALLAAAFGLVVAVVLRTGDSRRPVP